MRWWHYVGEFFLFNWLCDVFGDNTDERDVQNSSDYLYDENDIDSYGQDVGNSQSYDDLLDEQEDYDMMDDL